MESLEGLSVTVSVSRFFFDAYVGKAQLDAWVLAVPVTQVDEDARAQLLQQYLDVGLTLANVAGLFVPGLGQLMMGVAVGQLLGEVYEGVEDWSHQHKTDALGHIVQCGRRRCLHWAVCPGQQGRGLVVQAYGYAACGVFRRG